MSHYTDAQDIELATAVASAAFAIHSNEEPKLQYRKGTRESIPIPRTKSLQDMTTGRPNKETRNNVDEVSRKKTMDQRELPSRYPNRASSSRPSTPGNGYQNQRGSSVGRNDVETKPDAWERAQMKKIQRRYEKVKATIVAWENEKKMQAKAKMERRKNEIEQRRARNMQHYQIKQARIDQIAGGARAQAEEKRRNEESKVKEKAKRIRSTGKAPATCFCFTCN
ncbi:remorin 1.4-like isoform X1 [Malus sylvestris]|uniref:remorin 1.4-like isoform X1 n=1 Tax=Malus sylvestris TaxID=3752 RepID=UPI0021ACF8CF|nr:remorin 1.4-like isoform X1 [Malus sylvestris]